VGAGAADSQLGWEPSSTLGWVAPHVAAEFPGLGISWIEVDGRPGRSPEPVERRLAETSNRFYGAHAIHMRERPIPWAYRVFFRQIGLDPDPHPHPCRAARPRPPSGRRLQDQRPAGGRADDRHGGDRIALRAFDADRLSGALCIRDSAPGESLEAAPGSSVTETLIIADDQSPAGLLFGTTAQDRGVTRATRRIAVAAVQVEGVPQIAVDEAL